jgi:hypothetical protein
MIQLKVRFRAFGSMDGNSVESPFFDFPVVLCKGCVQPIDPVTMESLTCFGDQTP